MKRVAFLTEKSKNNKIAGKGKVAATYAATNLTCPTSCALRQDGCYAETGMVAIHTNRLNEGVTDGMRPEVAARQELHAIVQAFAGGPIPQDGTKGGRDLRLHVAGDARTRKAVKLLAKGAASWLARGGGSVWSYTHAWKTVPRSDWKHVSVLASLEDPALANAARAQGYAPALVVGSHASPKAFELEGTTWIPCPAQTQDDVACSECRLCMKADWLRDTNRGIAFAAHGVRQNKARKHLKVL